MSIARVQLMRVMNYTGSVIENVWKYKLLLLIITIPVRS